MREKRVSVRIFRPHPSNSEMRLIAADGVALGMNLCCGVYAVKGIIGNGTTCTYFFLIPFPSLLLPSSLSHPSNFGRAEFSDFGLLVHRLWANVHQVNVTHCTVIVPTQDK